ncbi:MAG: DUF1295 domain-containing protein, partial [Anaerolineae bacterium]|nr:DUF1295 domain-containing protein [Anaerolineae bacterium]
MTTTSIFLAAGALILAIVTAVWLLSLILKDASIMDIFWGAGFVAVAWLYYRLTPQGFALRQYLLLTLVTLWGLRLSLYIARRNLGKGEDYRYQAWRQQAGRSWWWRSYFKVFIFQGILMWVISAPLLAAQLGGGRPALGWLDFAGALLWLLGFYFEAVGDWQLSRFKAQPHNQGKLLTSGVWQYTRHPNYFGDAAQWWGFYLIALANGAWWAWFSP